MANLGSLVMAFVAERCKLDSEAYENKNALYNAYKQYATENDMPSDTKEHFCSALYAATGGKVKPARPIVAGKQVPSCQGIKLRRGEEPEQESGLDELPSTPAQGGN